VAAAGERIAETVYDVLQGIVPQKCLKPGRHQGSGINDRTGIHQHHYAYGNEVVKIAVFGGESRNGNTDTQGQQGHQHYEVGKPEHVPAEIDLALQIIIPPEGHEHDKLNEGAQQVRNNHGQRGYQPRKIHLAKQGCIAGKGGRSTAETVCKVVPQGGACQVKQGRRDTIGGDVGNIAKHKRVYNYREQRPQKKPDGAQHGLLVGRNHIAAHKNADEIAVIPYFLEF